VWGYSTDQTLARDISSYFTIGPFGLTSGRAFSVTTDISATTADASFGVEHRPTSKLRLEWSLALRYANYEETQEGSYFDSGTGPAVPVSKSNEGEMVGAGVGLRGSYNFAGAFAAGGALRLYFLDGELTASSAQSGAGSVSIVDDGRSGSISEFEVFGSWHTSSELVTVLFGWEQAEWDGIATDLVRVVGYLEPLAVVTGFAVTPVVGFVAGDYTLELDRVEVAEAFEVPLGFLLDERNLVPTERRVRGISTRFYEYHYDGRRIWGATAIMLKRFIDLIN